MKKTFVSMFVAMLLLVLVVGVVAAAPAGRENRLHFEGTYQAVEVDELFTPTVYAHGNASGDTSGLGQYTLHFEAILYRDPVIGGIGNAAQHLTVANGDKLFAIGTGLGTPTGEPGFTSIVEVMKVTGGTGQFADASGEYTIERVINLPTGVSSGTIEGNIKLSKPK